MAISIASVIPADTSTDIVLGMPIIITFNGLINTATFNNSSFSVTAPGGTQVITPASLITKIPTTLTNNQFVAGTFSFATVLGNTVVTFTPNQPLLPNTKYTVLVVGGSSMLASANAVMDTSGNPLPESYTWSFSTSTLNQVSSPPSSPLAGPLVPYIDPKSIIITPRGSLLNQDIGVAYEIDIKFPAPINPATLNIDDILISIEQFLNDPTVPIPNGLTATAQIDVSDPSTIQIIISGT